jgi:hypothetical protein
MEREATHSPRLLKSMSKFESLIGDDLRTKDDVAEQNVY